jgi:hypothetical protein
MEMPVPGTHLYDTPSHSHTEVLIPHIIMRWKSSVRQLLPELPGTAAGTPPNVYLDYSRRLGHDERPDDE